MIKTYRGLIANGGQDTLPLHTPDGKTGYRIKKFQIMTKDPGDASQDLVIKIYKVEQTSLRVSGATIDFSDNTLLAAGYFAQATATFAHYQTVIFDTEIFNQDIYVTHTDNDGSDSCNYYIELEQIKLTEQEALVAIVKDLREEQ